MQKYFNVSVLHKNYSHGVLLPLVIAVYPLLSLVLLRYAMFLQHKPKISYKHRFNPDYCFEYIRFKSFMILCNEV